VLYRPSNYNPPAYLARRASSTFARSCKGGIKQVSFETRPVDSYTEDAEVTRSGMVDQRTVEVGRSAGRLFSGCTLLARSLAVARARTTTHVTARCVRRTTTFPCVVRASTWRTGRVHCVSVSSRIISWLNPWWGLGCCIGGSRRVTATERRREVWTRH